MKYRLIHLWAVITVPIAFSCTAEAPQQDISDADDITYDSDRLTIIAAFPEDTETKVTYEDNGKTLVPSWHTGDYLLAVDDGSGTYGYQVTGINAQKDAILTLITSGEHAGTVKKNPVSGTTLYFAYVPGKKPSDIKDCKVDVDVSSQLPQNSMPAIMTASGKVSGDTLNLKFIHKCAVIGIKDIFISGAQSKTITKLTLSSHEIVSSGTLNLKESALTGGKPSRFITSTISAATDADGKLAGGYFIAMIPDSIQAKYPLVLTATASDTSTYSRVLQKEGRNWKAGKYYYLHGAPGKFSLTKVSLPKPVLNTVRENDGKTVQWAESNLGADSPKKVGTYYAWGAVDSIYTSISDQEKVNFSGSARFTLTYAPFYNAGNYTKYTTSDVKLVLDPVDDIVQLTYPGSGWQMPDNEDIKPLNAQELDWQWNPDTKCQEVKVGEKVLSFHASGWLEDEKRENFGSYIYLWSSQRDDNDVNSSFVIYGTGFSVPQSGIVNRFRGCPIRPVRK